MSSIKSDSLTTSCDKEWDQVSFEVGDEDDESESEGGNEDDNSLSIAQRLAMARRRAEAEEGQDERTRREEHQKKIYAELVKRKLVYGVTLKACSRPPFNLKKTRRRKKRRKLLKILKLTRVRRSILLT